jgi:hypothetical protein
MISGTRERRFGQRAVASSGDAGRQPTTLTRSRLGVHPVAVQAGGARARVASRCAGPLLWSTSGVAGACRQRSNAAGTASFEPQRTLAAPHHQREHARSGRPSRRRASGLGDARFAHRHPGDFGRPGPPGRCAATSRCAAARKRAPPQTSA